MLKIGKRKKVNKWHFILFSKIFFLFLFLLLFSISFVIFNDYLHNKEIINEIESLQTQEQKLFEENQQLKNVTDYLKSDAFVAKEAKLKFNLSQKDESVVVITDEELSKVLPQKEAFSQKKEVAAESVKSNESSVPLEKNYILWWKYFVNN